MTPDASTAGPEAPARHSDDRWLWALFLVAWFLNFGFSLVGWENTLISRFEFRQVQTALTTRYFPAGGFPLAYETPVFGPPWSIPLEFPLYEASVSTFARATKLDLDPAGRLVSWLYFQLSLPAFFLLLGSVGVRRPLRLIGLSLLLTSPLYLFFSRAFLMESTALCFAAWFLAAFARWLPTGRIAWLVVATFAGALGATLKVTTMVVFSVAALLLAVGFWWRSRPGRAMAASRPRWLVAGRTVAAFLVPVAAGLAWLVFSTALRRHNSDADILNTHFGFWSFGDLPQRLSADYWLRTMAVWTTGLVSEAGLVLGLYLLVRQRTPLRPAVIGAFVAFLSGQLIFSNLYRVHDYYFYASGVFLILALGLLLAAQYEDATLPRWGRLALPALIMGLQLMNYGRAYLPDQRRNQVPTELMQAVHDLTRPDDLIVILGLDWDATVPYYADRRALMFVAGRERDPDSIKRSIDRLNPRQVGAVLIVGGFRSDATFMARTMSHLQLGPTPLLLNDPEQTALWFPVSRHAAVRDRMPLRPYTTFVRVPEHPPGVGPRTIGQREIAQRREFARFWPRPFEATAPGDFSQSIVGSTSVLNAHAPTELRFRAPAAAHSITVSFGIHDGAYTGKEHTDGVEFVVSNRMADGRENILYCRLLDPFNQTKDQGLQQAEIALAPPLSGEIIFRTLPGPFGNFSFDWAYWGEVRIH
jgi:hypothetical protein